MFVLIVGRRSQYVCDSVVLLFPSVDAYKARIPSPRRLSVCGEEGRCKFDGFCFDVVSWR
jgi:hypothetical protein